MENRVQEWIRQAEYDLATAQDMHRSGRYLYAVFMCHLAIEKALKGLYCHQRAEVPPKSHNLVNILRRAGVRPPENHGKFMVMLSEASIPTRYPEDLDRVLGEYTQTISQDILFKAAEAFAWIRQQLETT